MKLDVVPDVVPDVVFDAVPDVVPGVVPDVVCLVQDPSFYVRPEDLDIVNPAHS